MTTATSSPRKKSLNSGSALRSALDVCPVGIIMADRTGTITFANGEMERMFGYARPELLGFPSDALVKNGGGPVENYSGVNRVALGGEKTAPNFRSNGFNQINARDNSSMVGVIVDISGRIRNEQLKDEFIATVSHELRTPAHLDCRCAQSADRQRGRDITRSGPSAAADRARQQPAAGAAGQQHFADGKKRIRPGRVCLATRRDLSGVKHAIEANEGFAAARGIHVKLDDASASGELRADPDWIAQIVTNLLSNAIKFSPAGGEVIVGIEKRGETFRISVRDHGRGIPDEFKPHIFRKFAQADATDARDQGGTGLEHRQADRDASGRRGRVFRCAGRRDDFSCGPAGRWGWWPRAQITRALARHECDFKSVTVRAPAPEWVAARCPALQGGSRTRKVRSS